MLRTIILFFKLTFPSGSKTEGIVKIFRHVIYSPMKTALVYSEVCRVQRNGITHEHTPHSSESQ